jgi:hypothetical protein
MESNFTQLGELFTLTLTPCAAILDVFATVSSIVLPFDANGIEYELSVWAAAMFRLVQSNSNMIVFIFYVPLYILLTIVSPFSVFFLPFGRGDVPMTNFFHRDRGVKKSICLFNFCFANCFFNCI